MYGLHVDKSISDHPKNDSIITRRVTHLLIKAMLKIPTLTSKDIWDIYLLNSIDEFSFFTKGR